MDVSGHGVGAAMMSLAVARQFLHGRAVERFLFSADNQPASPAEVVQILNGRFCSDEAEIVSYFTLIYGVIDLTTGEGKLCQAGHPTPFIVTVDGGVRSVGSGGAPVGVDKPSLMGRCQFLAGAGRAALPVQRRYHRM